MKPLHKTLAILGGGTVGALMCLALRGLELDMDRRTRSAAFDAVSILAMLAGFGIGAVCGLMLVPGKNPWRW